MNNRNELLDILAEIESEFESNILNNKARYSPNDVILIYETSVLNALNRLRVKKVGEVNTICESIKMFESKNG